MRLRLLGSQLWVALMNLLSIYFTIGIVYIGWIFLSEDGWMLEKAKAEVGRVPPHMQTPIMMVVVLVCIIIWPAFAWIHIKDILGRL